MSAPNWDSHLHEQLRQLEQAGSLRQLGEPAPPGAVDFTSNDYLGLAADAAHHHAILSAVEEYLATSPQQQLAGATGSRLLSGNSALAEAVESEVAAFHGAEAALLFGSGYLANVGLFAALTSRHDTILYDALCHASMRDGIRLSAARQMSFRHNDLDDARQKLRQAQQQNRGRVLIATEGLFSMDGDTAPLRELAALCAESGARLVVDEAHSGGILGAGGRGLTADAQVAAHCLARIYTYGKAFGCHGAAIVGSHALRQLLVNRARSFVYTTALPPHSLLAIRTAYARMPQLDAARAALLRHAQTLTAGLVERGIPHLGGAGPLVAVPVAGNAQVVAAAQALLPAYWVKAIRSPSVAAGTERLRICLHAQHRTADIAGLAHHLHTIIRQ